jgi:outer membrane protein W
MGVTYLFEYLVYSFQAIIFNPSIIFMKKLVCYLMALAIAQFSLAQGSDTERMFKKFKVDVSLGYAIPQSSSAGSNFSGGALFAVEPKYAVMDPLAIGLRIEAAAIVNEYNNNSNQSNGKANVSYLLTGDYYFSDKGFRPFLGAGAGVYVIANVDSNFNSNANTIPTTTQFGFMARAGFEASHFRLGIEYNFVGSGASYLGLKVGVCIGGGRIKQEN